MDMSKQYKWSRRELENIINQSMREALGVVGISYYPSTRDGDIKYKGILADFIKTEINARKLQPDDEALKILHGLLNYLELEIDQYDAVTFKKKQQ